MNRASEDRAEARYPSPARDPNATFRALPSVETTELTLLLFQQLQRPPGEEVGSEAVGVLGARVERRVLVSQQCGFFEEIAHGVVVSSVPTSSPVS